MSGPQPAGPGRPAASRIGLGRDPVVLALRTAEAWLRAAFEADPEMLARARAALDRRRGESR
jgi:hypothetical protein